MPLIPILNIFMNVATA